MTENPPNTLLSVPPQPSQPAQTTNQSMLPSNILTTLNTTKDTVLEFIKSKNPLRAADPIEKQCSDLQKVDFALYDEQVRSNIKSCPCFPLKKTEINDVKLTVTISNPRNIDKGYFQKNYTLYQITTSPKNWVVDRRYSDFIWLRECLVAMFPGQKIPFIPGKKLGNRRLENDYIVKRMKKLQDFINIIITNEKIKSMDPLILFLSCSDRNMFESQMKFINAKNLNVDKIEKINNDSDKIEVFNLNPEGNESGNILMSKMFYTNLNKFIAFQNDNLNQLKKNIKDFYFNIASACLNLDEIEKSYYNLKYINTKAEASTKLDHVFSSYVDFFKGWKNVLINQATVIKKKLKDFVKDTIKQNENFTELLEQQKVAENNFFTKTAKLTSKKESLYKAQDISKWEVNPNEQLDMSRIFRDKNYAFSVMCFKDNNELESTENMLGYFYKRCIEEFIILNQSIENDFENNLEQFAKEFEPTMPEMVNLWSELASNIKA